MTVETKRSTWLYDVFKALVTLALIIIVVDLALQAQETLTEPPELAVSAPQAEATVAGPEAEATVGTPGAEATVAQPETEATVAEPEAEATVTQPETEATGGEAGAEATMGTPEAEATVAEPGIEATEGTPEAEATVAEPEAEATPQAEATVVEPGAGEATPISSGAPPGQVYVVQRGDWLKKIAEQFWGDQELYTLIVEATNAKAAEDSTFRVITNPNRIYPEQKLWIPDR